MNVKDNKPEVNWEEQYIRLSADFENFRKQKEAQIANIKLTAERNVILDIITNMDDVVIAYYNSSDKEGFGIIYNNLMQTLTKYGVERYGEVGEAFDDEIHNAVGLTNNQEVERGCISNVLKFGYKLNGVVIRHADVLVEK